MHQYGNGKYVGDKVRSKMRYFTSFYDVIFCVVKLGWLSSFFPVYYFEKAGFRFLFRHITKYNRAGRPGFEPLEIPLEGLLIKRTLVGIFHRHFSLAHELCKRTVHINHAFLRRGLDDGGDLVRACLAN